MNTVTTTQDVELTTLDTLFVEIPISAVDADSAPVDLTGLPVQLAFVPRGTVPGDADWHDAEWNTAGTRARLLIGPANGGIVYQPGKYRPWWTVTDDPEVPARPAPGALRITEG